jgi:Tfp pilus assembly protein PilX
MLDRLMRRGRQEDGVVLVMVAILMVVFLGMAAIAVDTGSFYGQQRKAQAAADSAALAAASDLSDGATTIGNDVTTFANTNYPGITSVTYTTPYKGNADEVKVNVAGSAPTHFGNIWNVKSAHISASAVAGVGTGSGTSAVFAKSTSCGDAGITINGSGISVPDGVHSNGYLWLNGSGLTLGPTTYGGPNGCGYTKNGSNLTVGTLTADPKNEAWPYDYSTQTFPSTPACTFSGASFSWTGVSVGSIPAGTYCATSNDIDLSGSGINASGSNFVATQGGLVLNGSNLTTSGNFFANGQNGTIAINGSNITLNGIFEATGANGQVNINGSNITGNATIIASAIQLNGSSISLSPFGGEHNLLAYELGTQTLTINGSGYLQGGTVFAPNAPILLNGSANTVANGFLEGQDVTLNGADITIKGTGPPVGGAGTPSLLQ